MSMIFQDTDVTDFEIEFCCFFFPNKGRLVKVEYIKCTEDYYEVTNMINVHVKNSQKLNIYI